MDISDTIAIGTLVTIAITLLRIAWTAGQAYQEIKTLATGHGELKADIRETKTRVISVEKDVAVVKKHVGINGAINAKI